MKVLYEWMKEYVGESMPEVEKVSDLLTFHAFEIEGVETTEAGPVIDVKVLPDRAADALSHRGIARELGTLIGAPLTQDPFRESVSLEPRTEKIEVSIEDGARCRRFAAALLTDVSVKESPEWLKSRLEALGQRSINNVVDATNYVMLALGQPLHAYDAKKFPEEGGVSSFGVRMAKEGEEVTILGGETVKLSPLVQVITNAKQGAPVGIAGVKGGQSAEIDSGTTSIIVEAANFDPQVTRRGAQAVGLSTDASKRFENNISPALVPYGLTECVRLIEDIAGGSLLGYVDEYPTSEENGEVSVNLERVNALLGTSLDISSVEDILDRLGFSYRGNGGVWTVVAPFERRDIAISEDVIAEIGRVHGYEHILPVVPEPVALKELNARHYYSEKVRDLLTAIGFSEIITSSFRKKDDIELQNALASDKRFLRGSLRENIREALDRNMPNVDLLALPHVQIFETGTVFERTPDGKDVTEHVSLCLGVQTKKQGSSPKDDERLTEVLALLEKELGVPLRAEQKGGIAELNFSEVVAALPHPESYEPFVAPDVRFESFSAYPFIARDIALWVPESVSTDDIESLIREHAGELLVRLTLFDEFKKDGKTSYAFRLVFQSFDRTLTDEEVGSLMAQIEGAATARNFTVR